LNPKQKQVHLNILLADDDTDDCLFFEKALNEIPIATHLTIFKDGEELMNYLSENSENLPDLLFLDLNMPRKDGFECLDEIKANIKLKDLPVIIFSPLFKQDMSYKELMKEILLKKGAYHYISKTADLEQLKQAIQGVLITLTEKG
jgi:CheY-like chemotaxis protein